MLRAEGGKGGPVPKGDADLGRPVGVLVCHAAGQRAAQQATEDAARWWWPVPRALAATGRFVCLAGDFGDGTVSFGPTSGPNSWGSDHAIGRLSAARDLLFDPRVGAREGRVVVVGTSMGALLALEWARRNSEIVAALVLGCPILDLEDVYRRDKGGLRESIAAAYSLEPGAPVSALQQRSPSRDPTELSGLPMRLYATSDDPIASNTAQCRAWAEAVGEEAVSVVDLGPCGHTPAATPADDAVAFVSHLV